MDLKGKPLAPREIEAIKHVSGGKRNKEIATEMNITEGTVKMHLARAREKMCFGSRTELAVYFARILGCLLLAASLHAQVITTTTTDPVVPGATLKISVSLVNSAGKDIQAIGAVLGSGGSPVAGAASVAASKTLWSNGNNLLLLGVTADPVPAYSKTAYGDGVLFSYSFTIPAGAQVGSSITVPANGLLAVNGAGTQIPTTNATLVLTVGISASCLAVINNNIQTYLATPSAALLGMMVTEISAALNTGICQ